MQKKNNDLLSKTNLNQCSRKSIDREKPIGTCSVKSSIEAMKSGFSN